MNKIGIVLTILMVLSGCSAARPVIRTEEKPVKPVTSGLLDSTYGLGKASGGANTDPKSPGYEGLVATDKNTKEVTATATKADPIKNAADKTVGSTGGIKNNGSGATQGIQGSIQPTSTKPVSTQPLTTKQPDSAAPSSSKPFVEMKVSNYKLSDYYPLIANRQVDLVGPAGNSSLILQYLYEESGKTTAQFKQFNLESSQLNVISVTQDQITELYYSQDINYRENMIGLKDYVQRVILKAPLALGNQWNSTGLKFEITAVDESRVINDQEMTVLDVTVSTGTEKILFTYAVGIGLVSNDVINADGSLTNIVQMARIIDGAQDLYSVDFYYPSKTKEVYLVTQDLPFNTNDSTKDKLTTMYKEIAKKQKYDLVIGDKTQIQFIFSRDNIVHMDLNNTFIDFINAAPELENQRLESLVNTICSFYKADGLILTIDNQRYESANKKIETTQILTPLYKVAAP